MNTSPQPDVGRVLTKFGSAAFRYRSFNTVSAAPASAPIAANARGPIATAVPTSDASRSPPTAGSAAAVFSLLGDALPEAANVSVGANSPALAIVAPVEPTTPMAARPLPLPEPSPPPPAPPVNPFSQWTQTAAPASANGSRSLAGMFRMLSGTGNGGSPGREIGSGSGFPFRRR